MYSDAENGQKQLGTSPHANFRHGSELAITVGDGEGMAMLLLMAAKNRSFMQ